MKNLKLVNLKFSLFLSLVFCSMQLHAVVTTYTEAELKIVITPDNYPIIWNSYQEYGVDFTYAANAVTACNASECAAFSSHLIASGGSGSLDGYSYRGYQLNPYTDVTVIYDANGKIVGVINKDRAAEVAPSVSLAEVANFSGDLSISPNGSANYSLDVEMPPGIANMQPSIGVAYDSEAGKGNMGIGWGITGLSEISRCPRTYADDGYPRGVDYTSSDAYCLDGMRMVPVGNVYKLKNSNTQEIKPISGGFEVVSRGGITSEYGVAANAIVEAQGSTAVAKWLINKVTDKFGNYYTYSYEEDNANGDYRISRIDYTGNAAQGVLPFASVRFEYDDMYAADINASYRAGSKQQVTKKLINIVSYLGGDVIGNYRFRYTYTLESDTRLSEIYECAELFSAISDCKRPLEFSWNTESPSVFKPEIKGIDSWVINSFSGAPVDVSRLKFGDFNGDGRTDVYRVNGWGETALDDVFISDGAGGYTRKSGINSFVYGSAESASVDINRIQFGDFNGDGRTDIYYVFGWGAGVADQDYVYLANVDGSFGAGVAANSIAVSGNARYANLDISRLKFGDFNGDGKTDIYVILGWNTTTQDAVYLSNGNGTFRYKPGMATWIAKNDGAEIDVARYSVADFNGDGMSDLYFVNGWGSAASPIDIVYLATGDGNFSAKTTNISTGVNSSTFGKAKIDVSRVKFADFNGDGLTDVYQVLGWGDAPADNMWISKGDGSFVHHAVSGFNSWVNNTDSAARIDISRIVPGDFNGDGKADIYVINGWGNNNTQDQIYTYRNDGFFDASLQGLNTGIINNTQGASIDVSRIKFGDFTGDGALDIYVVNGWGATYVTDSIYPTAKSNKLVIEKIKDGFGNETDLKYDYLSSAGQAIYTKYDSQLSVDIRNFQGSMRVVTEKTTTDGLSGSTITNYKYEGARVDLTGRGQLGFAKTIATNTQTSLVTEVIYSQIYPYIGMVLNETQKLNGKILGYIANTLDQNTVLGNGRILPYISRNEASSYDLSGTHLSTIATNNTINNNGDITQSIITTQNNIDSSDTHTTVSSNEYAYSSSTDYAIRGLLTKSTVTKSSPAGNSPSVINNYTYNTSTYKLIGESGKINKDGVDYNGITKAYQYDGFGHINETQLTAPDIETRIVKTQYDTRGQFPVSVTNEMGHTATTTYDAAFGVPLSKTDKNGLVTTYQYDIWGQLSDSYAPGGISSHTQSYWCVANCDLPALMGGVSQQVKFSVTTSMSAQGSAEKPAPDVTVYYDKLGREIRKQSSSFLGNAIYIDTAYNNLGRIVAQTQAYYAGQNIDEITTRFNHDELGRVVHSIVPGEGETTVNYNDTLFSVDTVRRAYSPVTGSEITQTNSEKKNVIGQVLYNTDNDGNKLYYEYDAQGNKIKTLMPGVDANGVITNPIGTVVSIEYDVFGRKIAMNDPNMGRWTYSYDSTSKLRSQTNALGQTTTMQYDRMGRMVLRTDEYDSRVTEWLYNDDLVNNNSPFTMSIGKLDSVTQTTGVKVEYKQSYTYTYNLGLQDTVTTQIDDNNNGQFESSEVYETKTAYDSFNRPQKVSYPETSLNKRLELSYAYKNGSLSKIKNADDSVTYWQAEQVSANGQITQANFGGVVNQLKGYDVAGRLTFLDYSDTLNSTLYNSEYQYDQLGSLVSRQSLRNNTINYLNESYYYDSLQRLTSVTIDGVVNAQQFSYDVLGNMRSKTGQGSYEYAGAKPHAVSSVNGNNYAYNANGALTSGSGRSVYWTGFNKPGLIMNAQGYSWFMYGPSRARYKQYSYDYANPNNAVTTIYVGGSYEKVTENGVIKHKHYIQAGGNTIAQYTVEQSATLEIEKLEYLLRDNQGSVVTVLNVSGSVTAQMDYDAFGSRRPVLNSSVISSVVNDIPRGYTGHEHLDKLGLIHMNGRVYDPLLGRFLSADPVVQFSKNIQSYNRFSYVLNNPMSYTDPSGFSSASRKNLVKFAAAFIVSPAAALTVTAYKTAYSKPVRSVFMKYEWARAAGQIAATVYGGSEGAAAFSAYITDISGGSLRDVVKAAAKAYVIAEAFSVVNSAFKVPTNPYRTQLPLVYKAMKVLSLGAVGGLSAELNGGKFRDGFKMSAVGAAKNMLFDKAVNYAKDNPDMQSPWPNGKETHKTGWDGSINDWVGAEGAAMKWVDGLPFANETTVLEERYVMAPMYRLSRALKLGGKGTWPGEILANVVGKALWGRIYVAQAYTSTTIQQALQAERSRERSRERWN